MDGKLFIGIADNNRCASVVVGDSSGRILRTGRGGSVNYLSCGVEQARENLQNIITHLVGWERRTQLAGVCITYKSDFLVNDRVMKPLVTDILGNTTVHIEDFTISCKLGIHDVKDRLLLVGGRTGLVVFQAESGLYRNIRDTALRWNPRIRLNYQMDKVLKWGTQADLDAFFYMKAKLNSGACLCHLAKLLDDFVDQGTTWALEVAYDLAHDLVSLVIRMAAYFSRFDPVIGFYGPVLLGSRIIRRRVHQIIHLLFPESEIREAPLAPAKGAYVSALLTRRSDAKQEVINNFYNSARSIRQRGWLDFGTDSS